MHRWKDHKNRHRTAKQGGSGVFQAVLHRLYPEERFPGKWFPDLHALLWDLFRKLIKEREDWRCLLQEGKAGDKDRLAKLVGEILDFKNLLQNHPQTVVLMYRFFIKRFIFYKHGRVEEREDILQEVMARLMEGKIFKIRDHFDFTFGFQKSSSFTSYLLVTVRNIYVDIMRERNIRPLTGKQVLSLEDISERFEDDNMLNRLVIEEELLKLHTILKFYHKSRRELELCLKLKYRVPVTREDIFGCFPGCSREDVEILTEDFKLVRDKTMFARVIGVFNLHKAKQSKSDTLRKWTFVKIDEIVTLLNRGHQAKVYNRENIGELISLYYQNTGGVMSLAGKKFF